MLLKLLHVLVEGRFIALHVVKHSLVSFLIEPLITLFLIVIVILVLRAVIIISWSIVIDCKALFLERGQTDLDLGHGRHRRSILSFKCSMDVAIWAVSSWQDQLLQCLDLCLLLWWVFFEIILNCMTKIYCSVMSILTWLFNLSEIHLTHRQCFFNVLLDNRLLLFLLFPSYRSLDCSNHCGVLSLLRLKSACVHRFPKWVMLLLLLGL